MSNYDGTYSEIPFDQYQQQASIPKEAASGKSNFELPESNIAEIVLEHPGLELCRHHVEIVDSPGLNEHSARTAVTERLLQNTDAAIFLTSAQHQLTQNEQRLLQDLKDRLQQGDSEAPADNLFVLVNFMDMLRLPEDKEDVRNRVKNIICDPEAPLVKGDNRVHFISAQFALEAILAQAANEHSKPFEEFVSALETFLVEERGELALKQGIADVQQSISGIRDSFEQAINILEDKLRLPTAEQHKLLEKIGEISGFDVKIQVLKESLIEKTLLEFDDSWDQWLKASNDRLSSKKEKWTVHLEDDKKKMVKDFTKQFVQDISEDLDT